MHRVTIERDRGNGYVVTCSCEDAVCRQKALSLITGRGQLCKHAEATVLCLDNFMPEGTTLIDVTMFKIDPSPLTNEEAILEAGTRG